MLTASDEQNPDLFWAIRGAGANFGVVTSFRYRLHPLKETLAGMFLHLRERAAELIAFHQDFVASSREELDTTIGFLNSAGRDSLSGDYRSLRRACGRG
jgi:FAD/FMN-containing dehydrogenase